MKRLFTRSEKGAPEKTGVTPIYHTVVELWGRVRSGQVRSRQVRSRASNLFFQLAGLSKKQAALICQVEEKRRRREREEKAKREEDEADRIGVLKALAEDRAAFRGRCYDC